MPESSFIVSLILQSALLPFGVALAVLIVLRKPAMAVAAGFLAAYFAAFHAQWSFVPHQALDWLPWIALFGAAGAIVSEHLPGARLPLRAVIALAIAAVVTWPALASLGTGKTVLVVIVAAALMLAAWTYLAAAAQSRPTPAPLLVVIAGGAALALMLDASQAIGQSSGALAMTLAACTLINLPRTRIEFHGAANGTAVVLLGALLMNAYLYAGFSLGHVALLAGGLLADPLVAGINRLRRREGGAGSWVGTAVLTAVPVLLTIGLAIKAAQDAGGY
jgi:hypothetical protein